MARITLYVSDDLRRELDAHPDLNASGIFRRALVAELKKTRTNDPPAPVAAAS